MVGVKNHVACCGVSSKEKALMEIDTSIPCLPFISAENYRVFWLFPIFP
jgi:hypothetical protein